jgi:hypothetical protein
MPDAPGETFALALSEGEHSTLAASGSLCQQNLAMPTAFVGQNGATLNQDTHIEVEGCTSTLTIVSKSIKGKVLTLRVAVPGAGRLKISGKGLKTVSKSSGNRETLTIKVSQKRGGKLSTKVKLSFVPSKGKHLAKAVAVRFKK